MVTGVNIALVTYKSFYVMRRKSFLFYLLFILPVVTLAPISCETTGEGNEAYFDVTTRSLTFGAQETTAQNVPVDSKGMGWTVSFDQSRAPWLHVEQKTTSVSVSVDENLTLGERSATFTIAGDDPSAEPIEIAVKQANSVFKTAIGDYFSTVNYPHLEEAGGGEFLLGLISTEVDAQRNPIGDGFILFLNFIAPAPELSKNPLIADGTYRIDDEVAPFSFITGSNARYSEMRFFNGGSLTRTTRIVDGEFTIENTGGVNYTIDFDLTFDDGTVYASSWSGPITTVNQQYISTHNEDVDATMRGGTGAIDAWGDVWNNHSLDGSWEWTCRFWGEELTWGGEMDRNPHGVGDLMQIVILHDPLTAEDDPTLLPTGTYTINGTGTRNTAVWGGWDDGAKAMAGIWGSWYIDYNDHPLDENGHFIEPLMGALVGGTVTIDYDPATKLYHIVVDAFTDAGKDVKIDFEGPLFINVSTIRTE